MTASVPAPSPRRRAILIAASAVAGMALIAVVVTVSLGDDDPETPVAAPPSTEASSPSPTPTPSGTPSPAPMRPGEIVVATTSEAVPVYAAAGDAEPIEELEPWSLYGFPTTLLGFGTEQADGEEWIEVELVGAPNHQRAWVPTSQVEVTSTQTAIHVYLDERELELTVDGEAVLTSEVVIGADESPTPLGTFWVTDPLDFTANDTGAYGAFALGLNGYSETLEEFNGGPPQIAVHGTNQPELLGQNVSNGCIRVPNDVAVELGAQAPVGTPVIVHQSRAA